ncbi:MAG: hypothetical protein RJA59_614 [Pseudomonadota bacterium]
MTVRTELHAPILAASPARNACPAAFPALSGSRARAPHAGPTLIAVVWMLALAFFVFAVAVPAAVMERRAQDGQVARAGP